VRGREGKGNPKKNGVLEETLKSLLRYPRYESCSFFPPPVPEMCGECYCGNDESAVLIGWVQLSFVVCIIIAVSVFP